MGPPIPSMVETIEVDAPDMAREGRRLYETVKAMHSFVHGGAHLVIHALRGYPSANLIDVLRNRNLLLLMLCNVIVVSAASRSSIVPLAGSCVPTPPSCRRRRSSLKVKSRSRDAGHGRIREVWVSAVFRLHQRAKRRSW
jgi:hypothetical protein